MTDQGSDQRSKVIQLWSHPAARILLPLFIGLAAGFLVGFLPMWDNHKACEARVASAQDRKQVLEVQALLGSAVVQATRGSYEPARQSASHFFNGLRQAVDAGKMPAAQADPSGFESLFAQRDEIITLLARSDPSAVTRLAELYTVYRQIVEPPEQKSTMLR